MRRKVTVLIASMVALVAQQAVADLSLTNFELTKNSITVDIAGTMPLTTPKEDAEAIFIVNSVVDAIPGFNQSPFIWNTATMATFNGVQKLDFAEAGWMLYGDYVTIFFEFDLVAGEEIEGQLIAMWDTDIFDPTQATMLNFFWGADSDLPADPTTQPSEITGGVLLGSVVVPEPSTYAVVFGAIALLGAMVYRKRRSGFAE